MRWLHLLSVAGLGVAHAGDGLPTQGVVRAGAASIGSPVNGSLTIGQTSVRAVIDWTTFNIGASNRVTFQQPDAGASTLNRVMGQTSSTIAGQLSANGTVYLVNPNGIQITSTGLITVGRGFVASTLDIGIDDFLAGRNFFSGGLGGVLSNAGTIRAGPGGFVALVGSEVAHTGLISVPAGRIALGAGEQVTLDMSQDGFLQVVVPPRSPGEPAITGASVLQMDIGTAQQLVRDVVNLPMDVRTQGLSGRSGDIRLGGALEAAGGSIEVVGTRLNIDGAALSVASDSARGGVISLIASERVEIGGSVIDASGALGGGTIRIGGGWHGSDARLANAQNLRVAADTDIRADAIRAGDGGTVVLWSDGRTEFAGSISAQALGASGDGGQAEVSGHGQLVYDGTTDLRAAAGRTGDLLLDPFNVTISTGANTGAGFSATANDTVINTTTLVNALGLANVTVSTGSSGAQAGNVTVANAVSWASGNQLTINAANDITVNAALSATSGGGIQLTAGRQVTLNSALTVGSGSGSGVGVQAASTITGNAGANISTQGQAIALRSTAGGVSLSSMTLNTAGGGLSITAPTAGTADAIRLSAVSINVGSGAGTVSGTSTSGIGLHLSNTSTLTASGAGSLVLSGTSNSQSGLQFASATLTTSGTVSMLGTSASGYGMAFINTNRLTRTAGALTVSGVSSSNYGLDFLGTTLLTNNGTGVMAVAGTSTSNFGATFHSGARLTSSGAVSVTGTSGSSIGLFVNNASVFTNASGNFGLSGTSTSSYGLSVSGRSDLTNNGSGTTTATGASASSRGVNLETNAGLTTSGTVAVTGTSSSGSGVYLGGGTGFAAASGDLDVSGQSTSNIGLNFAGATTVTNGSAGALTLRGASGSGSGISFTTGARLTTSGTVSLAGISSTGSGLYIAGSTAFTAAAGNLGLSGQSTSSTGLNFGGSSALTHNGGGTLTLTGTSASGFGASISTNAALTTAGSVAVTGTSSGASHGVYLSTGTAFTASGGDFDLSGHSSSGAGISFNGTTTLSHGAGGTTSVSGTSGTAVGIAINTGARVVTSGPVAVVGTSTTGVGLSIGSGSSFEAADGHLAVSGESTSSVGLSFSGSSALATNGGGNLSFAGTSNGSATGLQITSATTLTIAGDVSLTGNSASGTGLHMLGASALSVDSGALTLIGDTMTLAGTISGSGTLTIRPTTASTTIGLGNGAVGGLNLDTAELATIQDGFSSITIGSAAGTGAIDLRATAWHDDVTLRGATAAIAINGALNAGSNRLTLDTRGTVTQSAAINAGGLELLGAGNAYGLTNPDNVIAVLAGNTGSVDLLTTTPLTVGTVNTVGLTTTGTVTLRTTGAAADVTLAQAIHSDASGDAVVIASGRNFVNTAGASAITTGAQGRFLVYAADWMANVPGGLSAGSLYDRTYATHAPGTITQPGSQFVYSRQPWLSVTASDAARLYGDANPAFAATVTGWVNGDTSGSAYSGAAALSTAASATSNVGNHVITSSLGTLSSDLGYGFLFMPGTMTVAPRPLVVTADGQVRVRGAPNPPLTYTVGGASLVNGDTLTGSLATTATQTSGVGRYSISQGTLGASSNYVLDFTGADLVVKPQQALGGVTSLLPLLRQAALPFDEAPEPAGTDPSAACLGGCQRP